MPKKSRNLNSNWNTEFKDLNKIQRRNDINLVRQSARRLIIWQTYFLVLLSDYRVIRSIFWSFWHLRKYWDACWDKGPSIHNESYNRTIVSYWSGFQILNSKEIQIRLCPYYGYESYLLNVIRNFQQKKDFFLQKKVKKFIIQRYIKFEYYCHSADAS